MWVYIILGIWFGTFVFGVVIGSSFASTSSNAPAHRASPEDKIVAEMQRQQFNNYFYNPVVQEMQRQDFFKNGPGHL